MIRKIPAHRRRFVLGSAIGGAISFAVFAIILTVTNSHFDLLRADTFGNFFDAQAHSLMHGHWDVPAKELAFEGIRRGAQTYTYFGLWPTLLRMPVIALVPSLYGRLTQLSMLAAFGVFLVALSGLHWQVRELIRPQRACGWFEAAAVTLAGAVGSSALFMASRPIVYNEAILWGMALSLVAYGRIVALIHRQTPRALLIASGTSLIALFSRPSVGLGPVVALSVIACAQIARAVLSGRAYAWLAHLDWLGADGPAPLRRSRWIAAWTASVATPVSLYAAVNYARFGSAFSIPWTKYVEYNYNSQFRLALLHNNGGFFGAKFLPTTLVQYLRPDAISFSSLFPWVTFPQFRASVIGNVDLIARTMATSISASMPVLTLLCVLGVAGSLWPRLAGGRSLAVLRAPLIGGVVGTLPVLGAAYVGNRYLGDFVPLLVVGGLAGLQMLLRWREEAVELSYVRRRKTFSLILGLTTVLAAFGLWANASLTWVYQGLADPVTLQQRTNTVAFQYQVDRLFGGQPRDVVFSPTLPNRVARPFTTVVVGSCTGVYWSDGVSWWEVEGNPASGIFQLHVEFPSELGQEWQPILETGPNDQLVVGVRGNKQRYEFGIGYQNLNGGLSFVAGLNYRPVRSADMEVVVSNVRHEISVLIDDSDVVDLPIPTNRSLATYQLGKATASGSASSFAGTVTSLPAKLALCRELERRAGPG